ncbi:hypothetical protein JCGZ_24015 [Jatropha curcas]|uniref:Cytochrome P450 n=1 Tax=Jatropha curcas TaxID=180498 RepID=A0A067LEB8_JATCU|nr:hypothetical protein JCGZ_24015 [Jatropha curcas]
MSISNLISLNQQWLPILAVFLLPIFTLFLFKSKKRTEGPKLPPGTTIFINAYAIGREPSKWENPEEFYPERFENSDVDYRGSYFELVPFGAGRRTCPGLAMGTTAVKYTLANLLYGFDFELPNGKKFEDFPMEEAGGPTIHNKHDLVLIPKKHEWD